MNIAPCACCDGCSVTGKCVKKDDAIKARLEAEAKYYGEFAPQRHLFKEYNISVNSRHSFELKGVNLVVSARSDDGVIEAIEDSDKKFFITRLKFYKLKMKEKN